MLEKEKDFIAWWEKSNMKFAAERQWARVIWSGGYHAAQQSVHLTALRHGLALSLLFNVVLLAVILEQ
jgi:hypothetical protein